MTEALSQEIGKQLEKLKQSILSHNKKSDICGLFSYHILAESAEWDEVWDVLCDDNWVKSHFDEKNAYSISSLGYSLRYLKSEETSERFTKAFDLLMQRDPFKGPHVTFPFQPVTLIGLILGVKAVSEAGWKTAASRQLSSIIDKRVKSSSLTNYQALLYNYARFLLNGSLHEISVESKGLSIEELSLLEYTLRRNIFRDQKQNNASAEIRENLIEQIIKSDTPGDIDEKAAIIWIAVNESISTNISSYLISPHYVSAILSRFEAAMKRWRYDSVDLKRPIRWQIDSEREVQDILWLILRSYFDDLIDEQALPKFGHKFYKPDFAIPSLRLLIEVKYAYQRDDFKKLEQEIMVDTIAYLANTQDYDRIIAFIYDESSSVQEHETTKRDLIKLEEIETVIIVSKPSQIIKEGVS
jgi:REase_DpnII-MboI